MGKRNARREHGRGVRKRIVSKGARRDGMTPEEDKRPPERRRVVRIPLGVNGS